MKELKMYRCGSHKVAPMIEQYPNGRMGIQLMEDGVIPYATLTVNLPNTILKVQPNQAFVDLNNFPTAEDFVTHNGLGKFTGLYDVSGFCTYPLYEFDLDKLNEMKEE